jgi:hypothetical protein
MDADRQKKVTVIKDEIVLGNYRVDPRAVADAILRRMRERGTIAGPGTAPRAAVQNVCSYPASRP